MFRVDISLADLLLSSPPLRLLSPPPLRLLVPPLLLLQSLTGLLPHLHFILFFYRHLRLIFLPPPVTTSSPRLSAYLHPYYKYTYKKCPKTVINIYMIHYHIQYLCWFWTHKSQIFWQKLWFEIIIAEVSPVHPFSVIHCSKKIRQ